jgi:cytoskeletal protein RodZ
MNSDIQGLRNWRKSRGITLANIASSTKLSVRQLEAIESGEFCKLPGGIYTTSYIRQYARAIDFDETTLLGFYSNSCKATTTEPVQARRGFNRLLLQS